MEENDEILIKDFELAGHEKIDLFALKIPEPNGDRCLSLKIEADTAMAMGAKLPDYVMPKLFLYDIMEAVISSQDAHIKKVVIYGMEDSLFLSRLYLTKPDGKEQVIESHISHAVALAFRTKSPVYVKSKIFAMANDTEKRPATDWTELDTEYTLDVLNGATAEELADSTDNALEKYLSIALQEENYNLAAKLKIAITNKTTKQ
jgi:bifunctional DNase/RNase